MQIIYYLYINYMKFRLMLEFGVVSFRLDHLSLQNAVDLLKKLIRVEISRTLLKQS